MTDHDRYVYTSKPRCPKCKSGNLKAYKSLAVETDGSRARYTRCRACSWRFIVIVEDFADDFQTLETQEIANAQ